MTFLERVCSALNDAEVRYVIVGGYAVALHGAVRGTLDVDIALRWTKTNLLKTEAALNSLGLVSRLPVSAADIYTFREEYISNRNLIAWNFYNPKAFDEQVDVIINFDAKNKKSVQKKIGNVPIPVLNRIDVIKMKRKSGRPQDIEDIKALGQLK